MAVNARGAITAGLWLAHLALGAVPCPAIQPAVDPGAVAPDSGTDESEREWRLCRVRVELMETSGAGSRIHARHEQLLFHGESFELERRLQLGNDAKNALVDVRLRVRAAATFASGVSYFVTSEAVVAAALGFIPEAGADDQVRSTFIELRAPTPRLQEVYHGPALGSRLLLVIQATPVHGSDPEPLLPEPITGALYEFRLDVRRLADGEEKTLQTVRLHAALRHEASYSMELGAPTAGPAETDPEHPLGGTVRVSQPHVVETTDFGEKHRVRLEPADEAFMRSNVVIADTSFLGEHAVETSEGPKAFSFTRPRKRLSRRKRERLREQAAIGEARRLAVERSKTLPGSDGAVERAGASEGGGQHLSVGVEPLHVSEHNVQFALTLRGSVSPGEGRPALPVDARFIEHLGWGESLEFLLSELAGEEPGDYDLVFSVTPHY